MAVNPHPRTQRVLLVINENLPEIPKGSRLHIGDALTLFQESHSKNTSAIMSTAASTSSA